MRTNITKNIDSPYGCFLITDTGKFPVLFWEIPPYTEFIKTLTLKLKKFSVFNIDILDFVMYTYKEYGFINKNCLLRLFYFLTVPFIGYRNAENGITE